MEDGCGVVSGQGEQVRGKIEVGKAFSGGALVNSKVVGVGEVRTVPPEQHKIQ